MKFSATLTSLLETRPLTASTAAKAFEDLLSGRLANADAKSFLVLLSRKGESSLEATACLKAFRRLEPPFKTGVPELLDTCGTGGDKSGSVNVSTLAAFVVAGVGGRVAKHGNRGLSSRCGSSDLMEALGVNLEAGRARMIRAIREAGIGYFHAPLYHPVFSRVQPLRRELGIRTIFNLMGPLSNPLAVTYQVIGVSRPQDVKIFAKLLAASGVRRGLVCHSEDGLDELSTAAPNRLAWVEKGNIRFQRLDVRQWVRPAKKSEFAGGLPKDNKRIALKLLEGKLSGPLEDLIAVNAAASLVVAGMAPGLEQGIAAARAAIHSGAAMSALRGLVRISRAA